MAPKPRCECGHFGRVVYHRIGEDAAYKAIPGWAYCPTHGLFKVGPTRGRRTSGRL
jgi:hypothetical protein